VISRVSLGLLPHGGDSLDGCTVDCSFFSASVKTDSCAPYLVYLTFPSEEGVPHVNSTKGFTSGRLYWIWQGKGRLGGFHVRVWS
jgi:hypothetical protein